MITSGSTATIRAPGPRLLEGRVQRGCNVHHRSTVFVQRVHLGSLAQRRTADAGPRFAVRFVDRFASLPTPVPGGPFGPELVDALNAPGGVGFDRVLLEAIVAIELSAARAMRRLEGLELSKIVHDPHTPSEVDLVWECRSGAVSRAAAKAALAGIVELLPASLTGLGTKPRGGFATLVRKLERRCRRRQWSPATAALALAAGRRGLPYEPLAGDYLRLGEGAWQQVVSASATPALHDVFPDGVSATIPLALLVGRRGTGATARDLDGLLRATGRSIGLATRKLTTIGGRPVDPTAHGRRDGARFLLGDPRIEMVVTAVSPTRVVKGGLRLDRATVTAILDRKIGDAPDPRRRGVDVGIAATTGAVVLDADSPLAGRLSSELGHERVVLISPGFPGPAVIRHLAAGGSAVVGVPAGGVDAIELRRAGETVATLPVGPRRVRRAMFTAALAFGLGLTGKEIVAAVEKRRFLRR